MKGKLVQDWMTPDPITVSSNVAIPEAYWLMVNNKIKRLLVVDDEKLVGIVTVDDLRQKIPFTAFAMDAVQASDILSHYPISRLMSTSPTTTSPDALLVEAAQVMVDKNISTLPVVKETRVVGIITEGDIFRAFVALASEK